VDAIDFSGLVIVAAVAFSARLLLGLAPAVRLPAVVLEIVAGIAIGPSGLGWVELDEPIRVLSLVGLAFLLFLAGLEIDFDRLRGRSLGLTGIGFGVSFAMALLRLQDTTAQIRVRGAFLLLVAFVALAERLGLEVILGAFLAGAVLSLVDQDRSMTHPAFRSKLEAVGFGVFIPVFFVASGIQFDLDALFGSAEAIARVPLFLAVILLVCGVPALVYRSLLDRKQIAVAALLQATSLPFTVAASMIGVELGLLDGATGAALVAAGLLSVLLFPLLALTLLRRTRARPETRLATAPHPTPS
jgi:Kef-type K+ transport system membrane component KefB